MLDFNIGSVTDWIDQPFKFFIAVGVVGLLTASYFGLLTDPIITVHRTSVTIGQSVFLIFVLVDFFTFWKQSKGSRE